MSDWVTEKNIADFRDKLARETDPAKRRILAELLAREQAKRGAPRQPHLPSTTPAD